MAMDYDAMRWPDDLEAVEARYTSMSLPLSPN